MWVYTTVGWRFFEVEYTQQGILIIKEKNTLSNLEKK